MSAVHAVRKLFDGPLDIVGDVHGELHALQDLLKHLGYDDDGNHTEGRRLVFVGDLCDRGHNSPKVFALVEQLVKAGKAQCILGNHELNLLRKSAKEGNGWFFDDHKDHKDELLAKTVRASQQQREEIECFLDTLPLALERDDLRVVHACWHRASIDALANSGERVIASYNRFEAQTNERLASSGLSARAQAEEKEFSAQITDKNWKEPRLLKHLAESDEFYQTGNPVRVLTSGVERRTQDPFFASGKWRFVERVRWWNEYEDDLPVVIGHYWRWRDPLQRIGKAKDGPDLFDGIDGHSWFGAKKNVYCVDFSVGYRYKERHRPAKSHASRLAAMRWPERAVTFEDGVTMPTY